MKCEKCGEDVLQENIDDHNLTCSYAFSNKDYEDLIPCEICNELISFEDYSRHLTFCGNPRRVNFQNYPIPPPLFNFNNFPNLNLIPNPNHDENDDINDTEIQNNINLINNNPIARSLFSMLIGDLPIQGQQLEQETQNPQNSETPQNPNSVNNNINNTINNEDVDVNILDDNNLPNTPQDNFNFPIPPLFNSFNENNDNDDDNELTETEEEGINEHNHFDFIPMAHPPNNENLLNMLNILFNQHNNNQHNNQENQTNLDEGVNLPFFVFNPQNPGNINDNDELNYDDELNNYEELLNLEDQVVGIYDINNVSQFSFEDVECPICSDTKMGKRTTNCSHIFCDACLQEWLKSSKKCPVCMVDLE